MTKLAKVTIDGLKNVTHGVIELKHKQNYLNVVGIYGQNGSGKTTLIDAVEIFRQLVLGQHLSPRLTDYVNEQPAVIALLFETDTLAYEYKFSLTNYQQQVFVTAESIKSFKLPNYTYEKTIFAYQYEFGANELDVTSNNGHFEMLEVAVIAAIKEHQSFVFGAVFKEWLKRNWTLKKYQPLQVAYQTLLTATFNLNIHTEKMNGLLAIGDILPLSFAINHQDGHHDTGTLPLQLQPTTAENDFYYPQAQVQLIKEIFAKISKVVAQIVPGMQLETRFYDRTAANGNTTETRIEVLTKRRGRLIPLRAESLGVQKLVSVLALLIEAYNNPDQIVLIDELDAGIFEFLLGELVKIMSEGAKGQLIFTSHNLRVLETLPDQKVYFSTNDANDRYTQLVGTRPSNNLRNIYIREIQLDETEKQLYAHTDTSSIKFAFEDANLTDLQQPVIDATTQFSFGF